MVLKLVDTRIEKNSKCEIYLGEYCGYTIESIKIYSRVTVHHQFKFIRELYRCDLHPNPFTDVKGIKKLIDDHENLVK